MIKGCPTEIKSESWYAEPMVERCIKCAGLLYTLGLISDDHASEIDANIVDFALRAQYEALDKQEVL